MTPIWQKWQRTLFTKMREIYNSQLRIKTKTHSVLNMDIVFTKTHKLSLFKKCLKMLPQVNYLALFKLFWRMTLLISANLVIELKLMESSAAKVQPKMELLMESSRLKLSPPVLKVFLLKNRSLIFQRLTLRTSGNGLRRKISLTF